MKVFLIKNADKKKLISEEAFKMIFGDIFFYYLPCFPINRICFFVQVNVEPNLKTLSSLQQVPLFLYTALFSTFSLRKHVFSCNFLEHFIF